jgi:hypothetical protein
LETTGSGDDQARLRRLIGSLIDEMDQLQQRLGQIDQLAEALLADDDPTSLDEPTRCALRELRRVAARDDAAAVRDELDQRGPST